MMNNKKIALVLGGGGARGVAHAGVLKILDQAGIKLDFIIGVSMGAIIGAAYSLGKSGQEIEDFTLSLTKRQLTRFFKAGRPDRYLIRADKGFDYLDKHLLERKSFSDTILPFYVLATNLNTGQAKLLQQGRLINALKASSCVPGIFPPEQIGDDYYIDGGVANPTPIDKAQELGADVIIAVDFIINPAVKLENPNILTTLLQSYEIIRTDALKVKLSQINEKPILIMPEMRGAVDSFKFHKIKDFLQSGAVAAQQALPEIKQKIAQ